MNSIDVTKEKFEKLSQKRDQADRRKIELETQIGVAKKDLESKLKQLNDEYGIASVADAEKELEKFQSSIDAEMKECEEFLSKFEV